MFFFCISFIYASVHYQRCCALQALLRNFSSLRLAWLVLGNFNSILGAHEQLGGNLPIKAAYCLDFSDIIVDCNLTDIVA